MIKLDGKVVCIFGLRGSGKSTLADYIALPYHELALFYDVLHEVPANSTYFSYQPRDRYSISELENVITRVINAKRYSLFIIDEANRFARPKPAPLPKKIAELNDECRHIGLTVIYIARRPTQLNQDLTELADYLMIFQLSGKNDVKYLNDLSTGLGDKISKLKPYTFALVDRARDYKIYPAIQPSETWTKRKNKGIEIA